MSQSDFICLSCPLAECDEESMFCALRWATNPNRRQRAVKYELKLENADRREYFRMRYQLMKEGTWKSNTKDRPATAST